VLVLVLGSLAAFGPLAIDMYLPAFSAIGRDLGTSSGAVGWTLAVYFVGLAIGQIVIGPITDRIGRIGPLRMGLLVFGAGSLAAAAASSIEMLMAARGLQSLGGAACAVTSRAIVRDLYRGADAARINSRQVLVMGVAPIVAPLLGGALLDLCGWRSIFVALAVLAGASHVAVRATLPETAPPRTTDRLIAVASGLLSDRGFISHTIVAAASSAAMFAYITGSPVVFIEHFHIAPKTFGWFFGANAAAYIAASQLNARLLRMYRPAALLSVGLFASISSASALMMGALADWGLWPIAAGCCCFLASLGFIMPNAISLALENQAARAGTASAWIGSSQFGLAGAASAMVSARHDGTVRSTALTMLILAAVASTARFAVHREPISTEPSA
jgi:MFS transporter, DHA1 family, multidrug resistance protein